jgi:hypothetical protein
VLFPRRRGRPIVARKPLRCRLTEMSPTGFEPVSSCSGRADSKACATGLCVAKSVNRMSVPVDPARDLANECVDGIQAVQCPDHKCEIEAHVLVHQDIAEAGKSSQFLNELR